MADVSPAARDRADRTTLAAPVFGSNAARIAAAVLRLGAGRVLVAVVDAQLGYGGEHEVDTADIVDRVAALEGPGGWAMVFSPGVDEAEVRRRATEMASLAAARRDASDRLLAKRAGG
jgi:hypothetical protein